MKRSHLSEIYYIHTYNNEHDTLSWVVMETDMYEPILPPLVIKRRIYEG